MSIHALIYILIFQVPKLQGTIVKIHPPTTITAWDTTQEICECFIQDTTGQIMVTLWEKQVLQVQLGQSYELTNLKTRLFRDIFTLTTTKSTNITAIAQTMVFPKDQAPQIVEVSTDVMELTSKPQGAHIEINKLCPKCHRPQKDFNPKHSLHRCLTCKILRSASNYIIKCYGILEVLKNDELLTLTVSNSVLTKFLKEKLNLATTDAQDIEEFLLSTNSINFTYTNTLQIINLSETVSNSDEELFNLPISDMTVTITTCKKKEGLSNFFFFFSS